MLTLQEIRTELTDEQYENFVQAVMYENLLGSVEEVEAFILSKEYNMTSDAILRSFCWDQSRLGYKYWQWIYLYLNVRCL